jgi:hypothetical protein
MGDDFPAGFASDYSTDEPTSVPAAESGQAADVAGSFVPSGLNAGAAAWSRIDRFVGVGG